jgi:DNA internalization-related competence protein ComEC/Rec2
LLPAFAFVVALAALRGAPPLVDAETHTQRWAGTVVGDVRSSDGVASFPFALDGGPVVRAGVRGVVGPGDRLVVRGRLAPFDEPRNPGEPSRRAIALGEGLAGELVAGRVLSRAPPDPRDVRTWAARLRAALSGRLRALIPEPEATVLAGALWGERGTLPHALRDDFQATGTVHVLVTAGLHLGVVAGLVLALLRLIGVPRIAASLGAMPCVIAYAWLSGAHLPSQRAAVMVCLALLARAWGARLFSWNALALAALVVAAIWPSAVATVSFALSFSCVAAIVLFAKPVTHALERVPMPSRIREALALTIATQIGVWPLSAATFGVLAPYAILANAIVVPATALGMLSGIATLASAAIQPLGTLAAYVATWDVDAITWVVRHVASLPGARIAVAPPSMSAIIAYDALAVLAARLLRRYPRIAVGILVAASLTVLATTLRLPDGHLTITMLDVGQGDGIVVRTPRGHTILIDTGGRLERGPSEGDESPAELVGERIVLAYLRRAGIGHIDLMVLTHPHGDHVGGCAPIVRALPVDAIADSGQQYGGRAYVDCLAAAGERGVPVRVVRSGMRWQTDDGVVLDVLAPSEPFLAETGDDVNENSIVVRLSYRLADGRTYRALFTGDAGEGSEARLLASGVDLRADLLKVGHHGSRWASTTAFLAAVRPHDALISVGRHNSFGHPSPETLDRLVAAGVSVYRTDRCGAIRIVADAHSIAPLLCAGQPSGREEVRESARKGAGGGRQMIGTRRSFIVGSAIVGTSAIARAQGVHGGGCPDCTAPAQLAQVPATQGPPRPSVVAPTIAFESVPGFLKLPPDLYLGEASGVAVNSKGHVFVFSRGNTTGPAYGASAAQLLEFGPDGRFLREIGHNLYAWSFAHTVKIDRYDNIWCTDKGSDMVVKFDPEGRVAMVFGRKQEASDEATGPLKHPNPPLPPEDGRFRQVTDVAWDTDDNTYISDGYINSRVAKVDKNGVWLGSWGTPGAGPGQFNTPHSIAVDAQNRVYVADRGNRRIQVFDVHGAFIREIHIDVAYDPDAHPAIGARPTGAALQGLQGPGAPWAIAISPPPHQYLYSSDAYPGRIYKLTLEGEVVGVLGHAGKQLGEFGWIHEMAAPAENELYVAELLNWRVQKLLLHPTS